MGFVCVGFCRGVLCVVREAKINNSLYPHKTNCLFLGGYILMNFLGGETSDLVVCKMYRKIWVVLPPSKK